MVHSSTYLARREALDGGIGLLDENIPGSQNEDWDLALRAARRTRSSRGRIAAGAGALGRRPRISRSSGTRRPTSLLWMLAHHPELAASPRARRGSTGSSPSPMRACGGGP